uniref:Uncharacterized protein LOC102810391 n=1 Tax=Saccoglossus kowalevskii TaxID=10224 RepID=A0ABM0MEI5_SACKO|nr:PREDICTED: uncharacterized protein LOC102810391 [Saccoglossus kowalevskii]
MTSKAISIICKELKLAECKTFCRTLDVTEVEIDTIMNNNPHDTETQKYKMLDLWMRRCGSKDTASILHDKLFEMEFLNAAEKVKSLPQSQGSTTSVDDIASGIQEVSLGSTAYDECPLGTQESSTNLKKGPRRPRTMKIKNLKYSELDEFCSDMSVERENSEYIVYISPK